MLYSSTHLRGVPLLYRVSLHQPYKSDLTPKQQLATCCQVLPLYRATMLELVPTLMIDDAETKMRTEASVLFQLKNIGTILSRFTDL
jgi:hypothetical protein